MYCHMLYLADNYSQTEKIMKPLGPFFDWIARISAIIGVLILLLGALAIFFNFNILAITNATTFFLAANSCFFITIILYLSNIRHKKE